MNRVIEFIRRNKQSFWLRPLFSLKNIASSIKLKVLGALPAIYMRDETYKRNALEHQRLHWKQSFIADIKGNDRTKFGWGKIEDESITQKRYAKLKAVALNQIQPGQTVLDLGCYDGFWEAHFLEKNPKLIYCVDIFDDSRALIEKKYGNDKIRFYLTNGYELSGIADQSVDFIFSIDSLVRAEPDHIRKYFSEFKRVLKKSGSVMIHLPCTSSDLSVALRFTYLTIHEIKELGQTYFLDFHVNTELLRHGLIFFGSKPK